MLLYRSQPGLCITMIMLFVAKPNIEFSSCWNLHDREKTVQSKTASKRCL